MSRSKAREEAFLLLFQMEMQKAEPSGILELYYSLNEVSEKNQGYIDGVVRGVYGNTVKLDDTIGQRLREWTLERISKVALCVLRLALYEMEFLDDVPVGVAINEAVELAKKYEGEEGAAFVNGVLGKVSKESEDGV